MLVEEVDTLSLNRTEAVESGLRLWLARQRRAAKASTKLENESARKGQSERT
jgi:hypothetical protein